MPDLLTMADAGPKPRRRGRPADPARIAEQAVALAQLVGLGATVEMLERATGLSRSSVYDRLAAPREASDPGGDHATLNTADRRHLTRCYGRSKNPAVREFLESQSRRRPA